jgi:hypothetical protein
MGSPWTRMLTECRCFLIDFTFVPLPSGISFPAGSMLVLTSPQSRIMCQTPVVFSVSLVVWNEALRCNSRAVAMLPNRLLENSAPRERKPHPRKRRARTPHAGPATMILALADHMPCESLTSWDGMRWGLLSVRRSDQ